MGKPSPNTTGEFTEMACLTERQGDTFMSAYQALPVQLSHAVFPDIVALLPLTNGAERDKLFPLCAELVCVPKKRNSLED